MLLRKRAWDLMREEFPTVSEDATLAEAIRVLRHEMKESPENYIVVVKKKNGTIKGVVSIWDALKAVESSVLKDENLKMSEETDWDQAFARASKICTQTALNDDLLETDVPLLRPNDPLLIVLETLLAKHRSWAVVEEGGRVIGIVLAADVFRELSRDMVKAF